MPPKSATVICVRKFLTRIVHQYRSTIELRAHVSRRHDLVRHIGGKCGYPVPRIVLKNLYCAIVEGHLVNETLEPGLNPTCQKEI